MFGQNAEKQLLPSNTTGIVRSENSAVVFDEDTLALEGRYTDELLTYRAKKTWSEALRNYFLLETNIDYKISVQKKSLNEFTVRLEFTSPCGRYAFWKLSTDQAPEAQYSIEVGHLPASQSTRGAGLLVPEMKKKGSKPSEALWNQKTLSDESLLKKLARKIGEKLLGRQ